MNVLIWRLESLYVRSLPMTYNAGETLNNLVPQDNVSETSVVRYEVTRKWPECAQPVLNHPSLDKHIKEILEIDGEICFENERLQGVVVEEVMTDICQQGFYLLSGLRAQGIMHLKVKPKNLYLCWNKTIAGLDLKLVIQEYRDDDTVADSWTPTYMSPEQCRFAVARKGVKHGWSKDEMELTSQSDVYSFALSLLYLLYGQHCIPACYPDLKEDMELIQKIAASPKIPLEMFAQSSRPRDFKFRCVIERSLRAHPRKRIKPSPALQLLSGSDHVTNSSGTGDGIFHLDFRHSICAEKRFPCYGIENGQGSGISDTEWLSSDYIDEVQEIISDQFRKTCTCINGFQSTLFVPKMRNDTEKKWSHMPGKRMKPVQPPAVQIHHNDRNHWVTSVLGVDGTVWVLDSSINYEEPLSESLQIQLCDIYGRNHETFEVNIPCSQQQSNNYDCGVFAIANMVELCSKFSGYSGINDQFTFDTLQMRAHLQDCIKKREFTPFPRVENVKKTDPTNCINIEKIIVDCREISKLCV